MHVDYCSEITAAEQVKWNLCNFWVRETKIIFKWVVILASGHSSPVLLVKWMLSYVFWAIIIFWAEAWCIVCKLLKFLLMLCHRCRYLWSDQILCHWVPNLCSCLGYRLTLFQLSDLRKGIRWIFQLFQVKEKVTHCCSACTVLRRCFCCSAGIYWISLSNLLRNCKLSG